MTIAACVALSPAALAQTVHVGLVGQGTAPHWPVYIAEARGYFDAEGIKPDFVFTQSNAGLVQQVAAGSLDVAFSSGLVDPIRAIDKGAPIAIIRLEMQAPPYAIMAKPAIKTLADLKGKTISVGGAKDITRIFLERMLKPQGLKSDDYDLMYAGATAARFSALKAGAVDAAMLLPPFNFYAEAEGSNNVGLALQYAKDLPFSGTLMNRAWAEKNRATAEKLIAIMNKSIAFFNDPKNRDDAIKIMVEHSKMKADDITMSYDFLQKNELFESGGKVSKTKLAGIISALKSLGDVEGSTEIDRFILTGVTQLTN
jgi:ABC-type nitrate/sulfonate/bicarbonate transport system substrate-binding protein